MIMLKKKLGNPECPGFTIVYNVINYNMTPNKYVCKILYKYSSRS